MSEREREKSTSAQMSQSEKREQKLFFFFFFSFFSEVRTQRTEVHTKALPRRPFYKCLVRRESGKAEACNNACKLRWSYVHFTSLKSFSFFSHLFSADDIFHVQCILPHFHHQYHSWKTILSSILKCFIILDFHLFK